MSYVRRFDHIGITVADLDVVTAFFVALVPASPAAIANELGLRNVSFEVNDLQALSTGLLPKVTGWSVAWRVRGRVADGYVRWPEGIIVSLAEPIG